MNFKTTLKRGLIWGVAAEIAGISGAYYLYRRFKTDQGKFSVNEIGIDGIFIIRVPFRIPESNRT